MSIRPSVIDRTGQQPCLPANALLAVCERLAEGGTLTLRQRVIAALAQLRARISRNKVKLHLPAVKLSAHGTRYDVADIHALIVSKKQTTWTQ